MAVTRTGSVTTIQNSADSGSTAVTVPADATLAVVSVQGFSANNKITGATLTLGGSSLTNRVNNQGTLGTAGDQVGIWTLTSPATGSQTLAWNWGSTSAWSDGGTIYVAFYKGVDTTTPVGSTGTADTGDTHTHGTAVTTGSLTIATGDAVFASAYLFNEYATGSWTWTNATQLAGATTAFNGSWASCAEAFPAAGTTTITLTDGGGAGDNQVFTTLGAVVIKAAATGTSVTAPAGAISLQADAPTVTFAGGATAPAGAATLGADAPTVASATTVNAPAGAATLQADTATVRFAGGATAPAGALTLGASAPTVEAGGAGAFNTLYEVGRGIMDSQRSIVRTADSRVYIFAAEDRPFQGDTSEETVNFLRAYKADQTGIPTSFTEQDTANRILSTASTATLTVPDARIDSDGVVHLIYQRWVSSTASDLRYVTFDTATDTWGTSELVTANVNGMDNGSGWRRSFYVAGLILDANEIPHVVYGRSTSIFEKARTGGTWSAETTVTSATETAPAHMNLVNDGDDIYAVWLSAPLGATSTVRFAQKLSGTWGSAENVVTGVLSAGNLDQTPGIALNAAGNPVALYLKATTEVMAVKTRSGGTWSAEDSSGIDTHAPGLYTARNDIYLGEGHSIDTTPDIQPAYAYKLSGGSWSTEQIIDSDDTTEKDGSASIRWLADDPFPSYIDVAYMDEDVDDSGTSAHFASVWYAAVAPQVVYMQPTAGAIIASADAPSVTAGLRLDAPAGALTLAGSTTSVTFAANATAPAGILTLSGGGAGVTGPESSGTGMVAGIAPIIVKMLRRRNA